MRPVKAFGLEQGRQADHHNHLIGAFGTRHRLGNEARIGLRRLRVKPFGIDHLTSVAQRGAEHVQWLVDLRRVDLRTAGTLKARGFGKGTDDGELARFFKRQGGILVFQQNRPLAGRPPRQRVMGAKIHRKRCAVILTRQN